MRVFIFIFSLFAILSFFNVLRALSFHSRARGTGMDHVSKRRTSLMLRFPTKAQLGRETRGGRSRRNLLLCGWGLSPGLIMERPSHH